MRVFLSWWTERFGEVLPVGHALRAAFPDRWFRIHSLPYSKRYASNDGERRILLERQEQLADEVLGPSAPCFVVTPLYEKHPLGARFDLVEFPTLTFCCELRRDQRIDEPDIACLVAKAAWDATAMKPALLAIADDQLRAVWTHRTTGAIFAPYDGGVDVVVETRARRDMLRQQFSPWLSARPDGL